MDLSESTLHSFIIKLWLEADCSKSEPNVWRGYITHVPTGDRRYLKGLSDITDFVQEYLDDTHSRNNLKSRARKWLKRVTAKATRSN
ncbi:MAG TPA: hypothetical protein VNG71_17700 [Pyrinomonadaceae bacterium]|nr:hypothetical protein [Pyrinomonadaceae bacterium]